MATHEVRPTLPDPSGHTETGHLPCNEPLRIDGVVVGYCERLVKTKPKFIGPKKPHRGPHRMEWWT